MIHHRGSAYELRTAARARILLSARGPRDEGQVPGGPSHLHGIPRHLRSDLTVYKHGLKGPCTAVIGDIHTKAPPPLRKEEGDRPGGR